MGVGMPNAMGMSIQNITGAVTQEFKPYWHLGATPSIDLVLSDFEALS